MSGIAGIHREKKSALVGSMLEAIGHRGPDGRDLTADGRGAFGAVFLTAGPKAAATLVTRAGRTVLWDGEIYNFDELRSSLGGDAASDAELVLRLYEKEGPAFLGRLNGPFALAICDGDGVLLARDPMGQAPLYWGFREDRLCFASEMKALQLATEDINVLPPGHVHDGELRRFEVGPDGVTVPAEPEAIASGLLHRLERAVERRAGGNVPLGSWLSGGLDSAALAALACRCRTPLLTFSAGMAGAPDLAFARKTADHLKTRHFEVVYDLDDMLEVLPRVIYHLESFDAPLVRSSVANYLVAGLAARHVKAAFSGEGGDELFAGYSYLKTLSEEALPGALADAQAALAGTALQRVDRTSSAHGTRARTCFLDPEVVAYANAIPGRWKIAGQGGVEKWILRKAMEGLLPEEIRTRPKEKFWSGAGVADRLAEVAEARIGDDEFSREREFAPGFLLPSKEDLMYYRIFRGFFPSPRAARTMGMTVHREGH
jgi:asparagine synthase (glutamine-hydrolysing)